MFGLGGRLRLGQEKSRLKDGWKQFGILEGVAWPGEQRAEALTR